MRYLTVFITMGDGIKLGTDNKRLILEPTKICDVQIDLGPMTKDRISEIQGYFDRIRVYAK